MDKNEETISLTKCDNSILADEIVSKLANAGIAIAPRRAQRPRLWRLRT